MKSPFSLFLKLCKQSIPKVSKAASHKLCPLVLLPLLLPSFRHIIFISFIYCAAQNCIQYSRRGLTNAASSVTIPSFNCLAVLFLTHPGISQSLLASRAHCWLILSFHQPHHGPRGFRHINTLTCLAVRTELKTQRECWALASASPCRWGLTEGWCAQHMVQLTQASLSHLPLDDFHYPVVGQDQMKKVRAVETRDNPHNERIAITDVLSSAREQISWRCFAAWILMC